MTKHADAVFKQNQNNSVCTRAGARDLEPLLANKCATSLPGGGQMEYRLLLAFVINTLCGGCIFAQYEN